MPWRPGAATGVGSLPYDDPLEATRVVLGELPDLPHLPELPGRGPGSDMIGRACALLVELGVDLQPSGWRLVPGEGLDQRRARSTLARDLDALEELTQAYGGPLKVQFTGPLTLAAGVERPRGGRVVGDSGARRDLAQSLAEGLTVHLRELHRRVPGASLVVQLDEPSMPAVLRGSVPTASGFSRYRPVEEHEATDLLGGVIAAIVAAGAVPVVHSCAAGTPFPLLVRAGARGLSFDLKKLGQADADPLSEAVEAGVALFAGAVPALRPEEPARPAPGTAAAAADGAAPRRSGPPGPTDADVARTVQAFWRRLGFAADEVARGVVVTPACGLAGADPAWARTAMRLAREAAAHLAS
nr:methionine synthase [Actinopolymorpha cephalotaxi]